MDYWTYATRKVSIYIPTAEFDPLPENPTKIDAVAAAASILDYVKEFPFKDPGPDRAVWLACLLTAIMRPIIAEPVPGTAFIGNDAGVGKGLLVHLVGIIATGRKLAAVSYPQSKEETTKVTVGLALAGVQFVFLDNLAEGSTYGGSVLDSRITETLIDERILGGNQTTGPIHLRPNWFLTGNNITPAHDAHRRWLVCNIVSPEENWSEHKFSRRVEE